MVIKVSLERSQLEHEYYPFWLEVMTSQMGQILMLSSDSLGVNVLALHLL